MQQTIRDTAGRRFDNQIRKTWITVHLIKQNLNMNYCNICITTIPSLVPQGKHPWHESIHSHTRSLIAPICNERHVATEVVRSHDCLQIVGVLLTVLWTHEQIDALILKRKEAII